MKFNRNFDIFSALKVFGLRSVSKKVMILIKLMKSIKNFSKLASKSKRPLRVALIREDSEVLRSFR